MNANIIVAFIALIELIFRLYRTKITDQKLWFRWKALAEAMAAIPKHEDYGTKQSKYILGTSKSI